MVAKVESSEPKFIWDDYRDTTMGLYLREHELAFISRCLNGADKKFRLLDIGCGSGALALPLVDAGFNVVGVDPDVSALSLLQRHSKLTPLALGDSQRLPFADGSFGCVIAFQCLQYFDHRYFLAECNRVLCDGGLLIFQSLNRNNYKRAAKKLMGRFEDLGPFYNRSCDEVLQATADYGFHVKIVRGYNWVPFDRFSNNALVDITAFMEKLLGLRRLYRISPWVLIAATKRNAVR